MTSIFSTAELVLFAVVIYIASVAYNYCVVGNKKYIWIPILNTISLAVVIPYGISKCIVDACESWVWGFKEIKKWATK